MHARQHFINLNVQKQYDLLTLNGSKIHGPKGVGALFIRRETKINPIMFEIMNKN